jgi:hypothetical protein
VQKSQNIIFLNIFMFKTTKKKRKHTCEKCCRTVDIAYKRGVLYVWLPEVEKLFDQIVMDCQTKKEIVSCEYCIVKENCHLRLELDDMEKKEALRLLVPLLLIA